MCTWPVHYYSCFTRSVRSFHGKSTFLVPLHASLMVEDSFFVILWDLLRPWGNVDVFLSKRFFSLRGPNLMLSLNGVQYTHPQLSPALLPPSLSLSLSSQPQHATVLYISHPISVISAENRKPPPKLALPLRPTTMSLSAESHVWLILTHE